MKNPCRVFKDVARTGKVKPLRQELIKRVHGLQYCLNFNPF